MLRNVLLVISVICLSLWWAHRAAAQNAMPPPSETGGDCSPCHYTNTPSMDDLIPGRRCARPRESDPVAPKGDSAPDVVIMNQLTDIYVPVVFPHGLHANMENMGGGCVVCHHHGESGKIVSCRHCHSAETTADNLRQPGLKGAYHRQCLACHREWGHNTDCQLCHAKRTPGQPDPKIDPTDITGRLHPNVSIPDKRIYPTPGLPDGVMVTFQHKEHVDLFGKRCVDCHRKENCSRCHDTVAPPKHIRQNTHEDCVGCHDVAADCTKCHMNGELPPFDHARRSKFALKPYHQGLACQKCHKDNGIFTGNKTDCASCHAADWFPSSFDHAKTGLTLNEAHKDTDCLGCHPNGLGKEPDCSVCHDDKKFPKDVPGTLAAAPAPAPVAAAAPAAAPAPATENKAPVAVAEAAPAPDKK